ncbi:V-type ATP synthase subunit D [Chlamydiales bacterium STE3]|nr:V-type ATP synthase subunit D [Chlamydiales bacterium STE3]
MAEIKLTKNELRAQQNRLDQLQKYLPTLQLKKAMLQMEVNESRLEIEKLEKHFNSFYDWVQSFSYILSVTTVVDLKKSIEIQEVFKRYENIAGVEVPYFEKAIFKPLEYSLFETPPWLDSVIHGLRSLAESKVKIDIGKEKKDALENELREVSIRVNLFEKVLIPRAEKNIRKIKVFLGDQQLAAVSQAKVAKAKILEKQNNAL